MNISTIYHHYYIHTLIVYIYATFFQRKIIFFFRKNVTRIFEKIVLPSYQRYFLTLKILYINIVRW